MTAASVSEAETVARQLLESYGEAVRRVNSPGVDTVTRALVLNAVHESAGAAAARLAAPFPSNAVTPLLKDYAANVASQDSIPGLWSGLQSLGGRALSLAGGSAFVAGALVAAIVLILNDAARAGLGADQTTVIHFGGLLLSSGILAAVVNSTLQDIDNAWNLGLPARAVLAATVDPAETSLYAILGIGAPPRVLIVVLGPAVAAAVLTVIAAVVAVATVFLAAVFFQVDLLSWTPAHPAALPTLGPFSPLGPLRNPFPSIR